MRSTLQQLTQVETQSKRPLFLYLAKSLLRMVFAGSILLAGLAQAAPTARTHPANMPLLSGSGAAAPNLMLAIDNSVAASNPFPLDYNIRDDGKETDLTVRYCPSPLYGITSGYIRSSKGGYADYKYGAAPFKDKYICTKNTMTIFDFVEATNFKPNDKNSPWHAMRSADVNPVYYNPRITYPARKDKNGNPIISSIKSIDNTSTTRYSYCYDQQGNKKASSFYGDSMPLDGLTCPVLTLPWNGRSGNVVTLITIDPIFTPKHSAKTDTSGTFQYYFCSKPEYASVSDIQDGAYSKINGCKVENMLNSSKTDFDGVTVKIGGAAIPLKSGHERTDCGGLDATTCPANVEMQNIVNWFLYYSNTASAMATSIGNVIANRDYDDKVRLGYFSSMKKYYLGEGTGNGDIGGVPQFLTIGSGFTSNKSDYVTQMRGVRKFNAINNQEIYDWLWKNVEYPMGLYDGTRSMIDKTARYYAVLGEHGRALTSRDTGMVENPWATDPAIPASASNPEQSCRRSYSIFISSSVGFNDNDETGYVKFGDNPNSNSWIGTRTESPILPNSEVDSRTWDYRDHAKYPAASPEKELANFNGYKAQGYPGSYTDRQLYTPFGNKNAVSIMSNVISRDRERFSDLTAKYKWHVDFRPNLENNIQARLGSPTTWQNMTSYTIGYFLKPSGDIPQNTEKDLSYEKIEAYKRKWLYPDFPGQTADQVATAVGLKFPTKDTIAKFRGKNDDFILAGYAGGGRAASIQRPTDMDRVFNSILQEIIAYSGRDAGAAVSGLPANTTESMLGRLKLTVGYDLSTNSGTLKAENLDTKGAKLTDSWSSNDAGIFKSPANRKFFSKANGAAAQIIGAGNTVNNLGFSAFELNTINTTIDPTKNNFINYMLGDDSVQNNKLGLWRQRPQPMLASSVNSPPLYVRARVNMGYGNSGSDVADPSTYINYFIEKNNRPAALYLATNQGIVHVFNAGDDSSKTFTGFTTGQEMAAYLLRGTANKLPAFADSAYTFQYLADGPLVEHDVYADGQWKNIVFGTLGRGGNGIFALNAKRPIGTAPPSESDFLWEKTSTDSAEYKNLGFITNNPQAGMNTAGVPMLITTAGHYGIYNSPAGKPGLYIINPMNGALLSFIKTTDTGRGLGGVTLIRDAKKRVTGAYAGDTEGKLWRFNLTGSDPTKWSAVQIYETGGLPIYAAPAWQTHPGKSADACQSEPGSGACGTIVVIGTGVLLDENDQNDTTPQRLIGIWDTTPVDDTDVVSFSKTRASFSGTADLLKQEILNTKGILVAGAEPDEEKDKLFPITNNRIDWNTHKGWYLDLSKVTNTVGERVIGDLLNVGTSVFATSVVADPLKLSGEQCVAPEAAPNLVYGVDALSGGLKRSFDQNGDGKPDAYSVLYSPKGGFTRNNALTQIVTPPSDATLGLVQYLATTTGGDPKEGNPAKVLQPPGTGSRTSMTGTEKTLILYDGLQGGWRRTWRQIIELPSGVQ